MNTFRFALVSSNLIKFCFLHFLFFSILDSQACAHATFTNSTHLHPELAALYQVHLILSNRKTCLRYHFLSHITLDYVLTQLSQTETTKDYALLLVHDGMAVYGSLTKTQRLRLFIGTDAQEGVRFDLRTVCIPFISPRGKKL